MSRQINHWKVAALGTAITLACQGRALSQPSASGFVQVTPNVWAFIAQDERSANGALFIGSEAALAVDPGLSPAIAQRFFEAIETITDKPVRTVVLTHWHPDHALGVVCDSDRTYSLAATHATCLQLTKHFEQVRDAIASSTVDPGERATLLRCALHLPEHLIAERKEFDLGGHTVVVWSPTKVGHTTGDLVLWSPEERVLVTGDLFLNRSSPDMEEGSARGLLSNLNELLELPINHVIPGHFEVGPPQDLTRFRDYIQAVITRAEIELARGSTPEAINTNVTFKEFADFRQFPQYKATFTDNVRAAARELAGDHAEPIDSR